MGEKIMKSMEIRSSEITTSASNTLTGYVVRWDNLSELLWGEFYEKFQRGAFTEWLAAGNDVRGLYEHDHSMLLGRTRSGTLKLEEDETGLRFELTPPDTSTGRDVIELVKRGDISGMSFGFRSRRMYGIPQQIHACAPCWWRNCTKLPLHRYRLTPIPAWSWPAVPCMSSTPKKCRVRIIAAGGRI